MYEENNNENKFTITLEGVLDRNATRNNLKKELLGFKKEDFFNISLSPRSSKDFLSLSLERLKNIEKLKNDNLQKPLSFKSFNATNKSIPFKDYLNLDFKRNKPKSALKDWDFAKDKNVFSAKNLDLKSNNFDFYVKPEIDKLDLDSSKQYSYFKTESIKNAFKQNFFNNSNKDQTNAFKDLRLNSNFDKTELSFNLSKDLGVVDFLNIKNGFNDFKLSLKELRNLKDKKNSQLSLENLICKDVQRESANKILKGQRSFETEFERNDFLRKLYILQSSQNSNLNDFSFIVELAQKLKNEGHAKNDFKAISLINDFLVGENNLEEVLSLDKPTISLNNKLNGEPEVLNSNKIINSVFEPKVDPLLEKTVELLEWAKSYDFTSSVLDPLRNTFSNLGNILGQAFENLPLVEYMTNVLRDGGGSSSRGVDDDSRMP
ncbi:MULTISPECIES: hypothetical protein [Borreliella]|uniref:Uncharacterized protein n=1 Tax=Borreliella valaisiana VS116 TaxID=445987 RepID=C0R886_BORVA|nr:hypothetical protein [Borreliella valaisiana]ACN52688.1 conserved hypothetical protein [Borreliella valaisiana VS116]AIJ30235.1 hypothetical protein P613_04640 [Borreliella valaisiana Tom4006]WKC76650.1 hypothetical protein QIA32_00420 [Borreliella valaisiana]WVN14665.1 hypothetical protein KJD09_04885 [Borreliella valaisiana]